MKKIMINDQSIDIIDYGVQRSRLDGRLTLTVKIPKENISAGDLDILCNEIEANAPEIKVYENEEVVQTLTGFKLTPVFALSKDRTAWEVSIENASELEFQYGLLKQRADALEKTNADQGKTIAEQTETIRDQGIAIYNQGQKILDQDILIDNQTVIISEQTAKIDAQVNEIILLNDTLLEILMG